LLSAPEFVSAAVTDEEFPGDFVGTGFGGSVEVHQTKREAVLDDGLGEEKPDGGSGIQAEFGEDFVGAALEFGVDADLKAVVMLSHWSFLLFGCIIPHEERDG